jgi:hypothetical protein
MAWVATDNFNSYSDGDLSTLNGGTGWSAGWVNGGTAVLSVQGTTVFEGSKALSCADASNSMFYYRQLTTAVGTDGNKLYGAIRRGLNNSGEANINLRTDTQSRLSLSMRATGIIELAGSTTTTLAASYTTGTWYVFRITINASANTATAAYATNTFGGSMVWSAESSAVTMANSGDLTRFAWFRDPNAGTDYFDLVTGTDPSVEVNKTDTSGTPVEVVEIGFDITDTAGAPTDSGTAKYNFGPQSKSSTSWSNQTRN